MVLGVKSEPARFVFALVDGTKDTPKVVDSGQRAAPKHLTRPAQLDYLARELVELLDRHHPSSIFYRANEGKIKSTERAEVEGVIMQTAHAHAHLDPIKTVKRRINTHLGLDTKAKYVQEHLPESSGKDMPAYCKEAYMSALCGLE
jgi:hypothetical protein